jgi:hypothetical protein
MQQVRSGARMEAGAAVANAGSANGRSRGSSVLQLNGGGNNSNSNNNSNNNKNNNSDVDGDCSESVVDSDVDHVAATAAYQQITSAASSFRGQSRGQLNSAPQVGHTGNQQGSAPQGGSRAGSQQGSAPQGGSRAASRVASRAASVSMLYKDMNSLERGESSAAVVANNGNGAGGAGQPEDPAEDFHDVLVFASPPVSSSTSSQKTSVKLASVMHRGSASTLGSSSKPKPLPEHHADLDEDEIPSPPRRISLHNNQILHTPAAAVEQADTEAAQQGTQDLIYEQPRVSFTEKKRDEDDAGIQT